MFALLARKETRELLRERSSKTLDYLNQHAGKLRESAEAVVEKGRKFMGHQCDAVDTHTEAKSRPTRKKGEKHWGDRKSDRVGFSIKRS